MPGCTRPSAAGATASWRRIEQLVARRPPFVSTIPHPSGGRHNPTMSGPTACGYIFPEIVELAQRAIEEARAMGREYGEVLEQLRERERNLVRTRQGMRAARLERIAAVRKEAERQSARFARLASLADSVGAPAAL